eukprot:CAMPEP_0115132464 /NCGR_PEP_ID=MMETSP0227-20121206/53764_1 /TAXON_ID=89957 /ORGANISM="Polarella glacialis, Strain CCMP 1383" /LENGTH=57 /DNA_ID=CAMNT_0002538253 /DNA_START=660 /DNA_END=833 /DNA_ORIENTATION=+
MHSASAVCARKTSPSASAVKAVGLASPSLADQPPLPLERMPGTISATTSNDVAAAAP